MTADPGAVPQRQTRGFHVGVTDDQAAAMVELHRKARLADQLADLLTEATRQDFGTPGWRERVRKALREGAGQ